MRGIIKTYCNGLWQSNSGGMTHDLLCIAFIIL